MTKREWIDYCLTFPAVYEDAPFAKLEKGEPTVAVRRLKNKKIFAYISERQGDVTVSVKLEPALAEELRQSFRAVTPAWHMNKTHWSDVQLGDDLPEAQVKKLIERSYELTEK